MTRALRIGFAVVLLFSWMLGAVQAADEPTTIDGRVTNVTLYRGQALVTRSVPVEGKKGSVEMIVGNLPEQVLPDSLFAEGDEHLEVRAVRFRSRAVGEEPREEVRKLDEQMQQLNEKLELNRKLQELLAKKTQYLDKLEAFVAPTANVELSKGVLNAESLQELTTFSFEQRQEIVTEQVKLEAEAKALNDELALAQRKRAELTKGAARTVREAVLFLQKHADEPTTLRLNYLVSSCGWSPTYTMRAGQDGKEVSVEYNALIYQMTGEDWGNVALTLSTASPALSASSPGLAPFHVALSGEPKQQQEQDQIDDLVSQVQSIKGRQYAAVQEQNRSAVNFADNTRFSWGLNDIASEFQCLELTGDKNVIRTLRMEGQEDGEGPSLSYKLGGGVSLSSRSDQQMVRIVQTALQSRFYHIATPVLTSYVYREAELTNNSDEDLLAGPITVYLGGRFVGQGEIPTVARGQAFVVGFGADPQLRTRRELGEKSDGVQGGNRELKFTYRLVIENYTGAATPLRVVDRLPYAERAADIRVTVGDMSDPLSEDKLYVRRERPMGFLRWDVEVPKDATGENAQIIQYTYTVEHDRNFVLTSPATRQQLQQEFERLQRMRLKL